MSKDPAFLFYYNDFESDTSAWEADAVGWYIRLLIYQANHGFLPNDKESLAQIARVKFSQYDAFCDRLASRLASKFARRGEKLVNEVLEKVMNDRKEFSLKKSVLATFANILKYGDYSPDDQRIIKGSFRYKDHLINDLENRKKSIMAFISESLSDSLSDRINEDENEDENRNRIEKVKVIPTYQVFEEYAKTKMLDVDLQKLNLKYESWKENGWKDGNNKKIKNWKSKLLNTLPFLKIEKGKMTKQDQLGQMGNAFKSVLTKIQES